MRIGKSLTFIATLVFVVSALTARVAGAVNLEGLTCSPVANTKSKTYSTQVSCTAVIRRTGTARWHQATAKHCPTFCAQQGGYNTLSPDGFRCVSGEVRGTSSLGVIDFSPTGCWHDCRQTEGFPGSESVEHRCYSPGQKRDNDATDTTLGCYCVVGDNGQSPVDVGVYASGSAQAYGVSSNPVGWQKIDRNVTNDRPGRLFNVVGTAALGQPSTVAMVLNVHGACGTSVQIQGTLSQSNASSQPNSYTTIQLPQCVPQCSDGIDNDNDGATDYPADAACSSATDNDEGDMKAACQDGIDNDLDGAIDYPNDFSCSSPQDTDETNPKAQCQNGYDDDTDGLIDMTDPGCSSRQDNHEGDKTTQCQDRIDNDGDGAIDYPADVGCDSPTDNNEGDNKAQCQDGIDNDLDGAIDYPSDFSCSSLQDNDETNPKAQCQNGYDDDTDALIDMADPGCSSKQDNHEGDKTTQCQDRIDNDGDGAIDYPADAGCSSPTDDNEGDNKAQCQDGIDNDHDGAIDYPNDFSCSSPQDCDETDPKSQCQNNIDDDRDGVTDMTDPGCSSPQDNTEGDRTTACQDKIDNDGDGATDYPADAGCDGPTDNNEGDNKPQCQDGLDNDHDGAIDYPNDFSCSSPQDCDETDPKAQCQNGIDDDKDNLIDLFDPGCTSKQDNDEGDKTTECQDGNDNDGDGAVDYPADAGCQSPGDTNEGDNKAQCQDGIDNDNDGAIDFPQDVGCESSQDNSELNTIALRITPIAECVVAKQDGTFQARFGYKNEGNSTVELAIGETNYFSPEALDRGQPRVFYTGRVTNVFSVTFPATQNLKWTVGSGVAIADATTPRCEGTKIDCIDSDNSKTLAALDSIARAQKTNIARIASRVMKLQPRGSAASKAKGYQEVANDIYLEQWRDIWASFPKVSTSCSACAATDKSGSISSINTRAQRLLRLSRQSAGLLKQARKGKSLRKDEQDLATTGTALYDKFIQYSQNLPRFESKCN